MPRTSRLSTENEARPLRRGHARTSRLEGGLRSVTGPAYPDWDAVYRDNIGWVYRLMYSKVGNQPDAEDLTAEVFMTALKPLRVSATVPEVRKYLKMTARTVLASHWRDRMGREVTRIEEDIQEGPADDGGQPTAESGTGDRVRWLLAKLPDNYRQILELRFLQAFSARDAAKQMGVSVANAKVLQHRALKMAARLGGEAP
ncbi:RNA polymerase subunit sigma [Mycolicibacterium agri]|uniref:RNA polymerase subunit sigma n=1 Tax=Mycolicibacterium agri TaxID=36811 RepID=A0A2A7N3U8_MYCAG|nr:RNA polymerase subunit sigma [Mycolicibacterium agri]